MTPTLILKEIIHVYYDIIDKSIPGGHRGGSACQSQRRCRARSRVSGRAGHGGGGCGGPRWGLAYGGAGGGRGRGGRGHSAGGAAAAAGGQLLGSRLCVRWVCSGSRPAAWGATQAGCGTLRTSGDAYRGGGRRQCRRGGGGAGRWRSRWPGRWPGGANLRGNGHIRDGGRAHGVGHSAARGSGQIAESRCSRQPEPLKACGG